MIRTAMPGHAVRRPPGGKATRKTRTYCVAAAVVVCWRINTKKQNKKKKTKQGSKNRFVFPALFPREEIGGKERECARMRRVVCVLVAAERFVGSRCATAGKRDSKEGAHAKERRKKCGRGEGVVLRIMTERFI